MSVTEYNRKLNAEQPVLYHIWLLDQGKSESKTNNDSFKTWCLTTDPTTIDGWVKGVLVRTETKHETPTTTSTPTLKSTPTPNPTPTNQKEEEKKKRTALIKACADRQSQIAHLIKSVRDKIDQLYKPPTGGSTSTPPKGFVDIKVSTCTLRVRAVDIAKDTSAMIVNAANPELSDGGGVAGSVWRATGDKWHAACAKWVQDNRKLKVGHSVAIWDDKLNKYIANVLGPNQSEPQSKDLNGMSRRTAKQRLIAQGVLSALRDAESLKLTSIAIPCISSNLYGDDDSNPEYNSDTIVKASVYYVQNRSPAFLKEINFVAIDERTTTTFQKALLQPAPTGLGDEDLLAAFSLVEQHTPVKPI